MWCEESREGTIFHLLGSLGLLRFPQTRQKMLSFILFILRKIQYFSNKQQHPEAGERTSKDNILNLPTAARQPTGLAKGQCHKDKKSIFFSCVTLSRENNFLTIKNCPCDRRTLTHSLTCSGSFKIESNGNIAGCVANHKKPKGERHDEGALSSHKKHGRGNKKGGN